MTTLRLRVAAPILDVHLDSYAYELWRKVQFWEDTDNVTEYERAWEDLISYLEEDLIEAFFADFTVTRADLV